MTRVENIIYHKKENDPTYLRTFTSQITIGIRKTNAQYELWTLSNVNAFIEITGDNLLYPITFKYGAHGEYQEKTLQPGSNFYKDTYAVNGTLDEGYCCVIYKGRVILEQYSHSGVTVIWGDYSLNDTEIVEKIPDYEIGKLFFAPGFARNAEPPYEEKRLYFVNNAICNGNERIGIELSYSEIDSGSFCRNVPDTDVDEYGNEYSTGEFLAYYGQKYSRGVISFRLLNAERLGVHSLPDNAGVKLTINALLVDKAEIFYENCYWDYWELGFRKINGIFQVFKDGSWQDTDITCVYNLPCCDFLATELSGDDRDVVGRVLSDYDNIEFQGDGGQSISVIENSFCLDIKRLIYG